MSVLGSFCWWPRTHHSAGAFSTAPGASHRQWSHQQHDASLHPCERSVLDAMLRPSPHGETHPHGPMLQGHGTRCLNTLRDFV